MEASNKLLEFISKREGITKPQVQSLLDIGASLTTSLDINYLDIDEVNRLCFLIKTNMRTELNKMKKNQKPKQKPNEPCNCGSGKKYKKCCFKII